MSCFLMIQKCYLLHINLQLNVVWILLRASMDYFIFWGVWSGIEHIVIISKPLHFQLYDRRKVIDKVAEGGCSWGSILNNLSSPLSWLIPCIQNLFLVTWYDSSYCSNSSIPIDFSFTWAPRWHNIALIFLWEFCCLGFVWQGCAMPSFWGWGCSWSIFPPFELFWFSLPFMARCYRTVELYWDLFVLALLIPACCILCNYHAWSPVVWLSWLAPCFQVCLKFPFVLLIE